MSGDQLPAVRAPEADLVPVSTATISDREFERLWRIGTGLANSRMFKDVEKAEEAFAKILLGRDLGLSPTQSLQGIYLVEGNLQIAATTLASFVRRSPRYDYDVTVHTRESCTVVFWRHHTEHLRAEVDAWRALKPSRVWAGSMV